MIRFLQLALFLLILAPAQAQYIPNTAQPFQMATLYNPAFSGIDNFGDLKLGYRYQWTGYGSDAPRFINLAYNYRIKQPVDLTTNTIRTSDISALSAENIPKNKRIIQGLGVNFFNEHYGQIVRIGGGINYAFNYPIAKTTRLSIGISAMIDNTKVDYNKIALRDPDPYYNQLLANGSAQTSLNVRGGVLLYSPKFYIGMTYFPIVNSPIQKGEMTTDQTFYQGLIQGGLNFPVGIHSSIRPSLLAIWQVNNTFVMDYSAKIYIQNKIWFGFTYRDTKSLISLLGMNVNDNISFTYSFEMPLSDLSKFGGTSHDLVLAYKFNNFKRLNQYSW